jgi:hypothetical protein
MRPSRSLSTILGPARSSRSRSWSAAHRRAEVLRVVIAEANSRRDGSLPTDLPGVAGTFEDDFALVSALQLRWHTRLAGTIERILMDWPDAPAEAVVTAWRRTAADLAGVRGILDRYATDPTSQEMATAFLTARRKEWVLLAAMAGLAGTQDEAALRAGRALEERARASLLSAGPAA